MSTTPYKYRRILAIDPSSKGFGYVVLEEPERLVDWGLKEAQENKNEHCLRQVAYLVSLYNPDLIAVEDVSRGSRRCDRVRKLIRAIHQLGIKHGVTVRSISKPKLREAFVSSNATTKDAIAKVLADRFPELADRLPPPRRPWDGQNPNMAIFKAMAMAVALRSEK